MKLLVLGGTVFLGRHVVEQALAQGHEVTLFNRGRTNPDLFGTNVEKIVGDRDHDLARLQGRHFDACIDPSGYLPGQLERAGSALRDSVDRYVFISSISVYPEFSAGLDETGAVDELADDIDRTKYDAKYYGAFKVLCERAIESAMPGRVVHVRSGLIVGPYDPTHRFTYWPVRMAEGGDVLAPDDPSCPVQIIHAADQARWILHVLANDLAGIFNVTSDNGTYTLGDLFAATRAVTGVEASPVWVPSAFLLANRVTPWMELPLWLPESSRDMSRVSARKAVRSGMTLMPLTEVVRTTLDWYRGEPPRAWPAGLARDRERQLIERWRGTLG